MRKQFATWAATEFADRPNSIFLTGDLGYNALEGVASKLGQRFVNAGVAEQNMISMAASLAHEGLLPVCYSIAPFTVFRPAEQIRLDVCIHNKNVKIVGNGGGYGYGIMGASHHALEDLAVLSCLPNMRCYVPVSDDDVNDVCGAMIHRAGPAYLRLGAGKLPEGTSLPKKYEPIRQMMTGKTATIVGIGPVLLNAWGACLETKLSADIFCVSELPLIKSSDELKASLGRTGHLIVIEEHVERGGLGENLARLLLGKTNSFQFTHLHAKGYPNGLYGSQSYHQKMSGLDKASIATLLTALESKQ